MAATLGGVDLSKLHQLSDRKSGNIIVLPIPTLDSDETEAIDLGGNTRTITMTGLFDTNTVADTKAKADALRGLMTANQTPITLSTDQTGSVSVMVRNVDITWDISDTPVSNIAGYSVTVVEAKAT